MKTCIDCNKPLLPGPDWPETYQNGKLYRHTHCNLEVGRSAAVVRRAIELGEGLTRSEYSKLDRADQRMLRAKYAEASPPTNTAPTTSKFEHPELDRIIRERKANYSFADKVEATKRDGFVYVIVHPSFPAVCKIGRSRDPNKRLSAANTWCPYSEFELHCAVYSDDAVKLEAEVHEALARRDRNEVGEWFFINKWHAENLIHMVKEGRDNGNTNSRHRSQRIPPCRGHDLAG